MSQRLNISLSGGNAKADARERAFRALVACYDGGRKGLDVLYAMGHEEALSSADAGLAAEIVTGVLRHRLTLEHISAYYFRGRWGGVRPSIRTVLSMGIYQLCWLDRIPSHAAVDQSVRLAKRYGVGAASMANAVLRKVAECRGDVIDRPEDVNPRRWLELEPGRGRLLKEDVFPDPAKRPLEYIVAATSHPAFLVERWHRRFKPKLCHQICEAGQGRAALVLRANRLRVSEDELFEKLSEAGHACERSEGSPGIIVHGSPSVVALPGFEEGLFQPQDGTAQGVLLMSPPAEGEFVVDLCAGLGTKATQAAELMGNRGDVLACDIDGEKLGRIGDNAARLGITIIRTCTLDGLDAELKSIGRAVDMVLVDAPCTNTGVLGRRPEARYRATHAMLAEMVTIQRDILGRAVEIVGENGRIIYSTCSIEQEENEEQTAWFCQANEGWTVERQELVLPRASRGGGGFAAVLRKQS
ncbi:MAG: hypothetical protein HS101_18795 [Planctomycetia bacterium]|nr:hypothetical protein [Planctomycetia bacterium]MCC7316314.1 hypothetical protein [Planctomycetota bacterium]